MPKWFKRWLLHMGILLLLAVMILGGSVLVGLWQQYQRGTQPMMRLAPAFTVTNTGPDCSEYQFKDNGAGDNGATSTNWAPESGC